MTPFILWILLGVFLIVVSCFLFYKKRKRQKELIRKTHAVSERRNWQVAYFMGELLADEENFTIEGNERIRNLKKEMTEFKASTAKKLNEYRNSLRETTREARKEVLFDPFDKVGLASSMYSLGGKILQYEARITLYQYELTIIYTALAQLTSFLRTDPIFSEKTLTALDGDVAYLEKRQKTLIPFSELEKEQIRHIESVIKRLSIPDISNDLLPRLAVLKTA